MAGLGAKLWTVGEIATAANMNGYLQDQTVMVFANTTARDAAFGGTGEPVLSEGMFAYTSDTNTLWFYTGSAWEVSTIKPSVVDAKGDLLVGTAADTVGRLAVGSNGSVLMADSTATSGVMWADQSLSNRNVIINGAMQVTQRATSVASLNGTGYQTADRFNMVAGSGGTYTQSVENDAPTGSGFRKSLKMLCTTAVPSLSAGAICTIAQELEGQNIQQFLKGTPSAKQFAVSFWVKSNVTGTYICELFDRDNTRQVSASYTISASATWEKKTIIFPADTTGAFDNDNAASMFANFWLVAGSTYAGGTLNTTWASNTNANRAVGQTNLAAATNNYWQVTGVQLEVGSVATPFEFEDYGTTLAKCQRYYHRMVEGAGVSIGVGFYVSATQVDTIVSFPVTMRTAPTAVVATGTNYYVFQTNSIDDYINSVDIARQGVNTALLTNSTQASGVEFRAGRYQTNNASSSIAFNAEL